MSMVAPRIEMSSDSFDFMALKISLVPLWNFYARVDTEYVTCYF